MLVNQTHETEVNDIEHVVSTDHDLIIVQVYVLIVNRGKSKENPVWVRTRIAEMIEVEMIRAREPVLHEDESPDFETVWYNTETDQYFALTDKTKEIEVVKAGGI